jgi:hypothetical protein
MRIGVAAQDSALVFTNFCGHDLISLGLLAIVDPAISATTALAKPTLGCKRPNQPATCWRLVLSVASALNES